MESSLHNKSMLASRFGSAGFIVKVVAVHLVLILVAVAQHPQLMLCFLGGLAGIVWLHQQNRLLPILPMILAVQWTQAGIALLYCEYTGITINDLYGNWFVDDAIYLTSLGVFSLAIGMCLPNLARQKKKLDQLYLAVNEIDGRKAFILYFCFLALNYIVSRSFFELDNLRQVVLAASGMKWVAFYVLALAALARTQYLPYLLLALLVEVVVGSLGFFAHFRTAFIIILVAVLTHRQKFSAKTMTIGLCSLLMLIALLVAWSSVKQEYRAYVNQGSRQQVVLVPTKERFTTLISMVGELGIDDLKDGFAQLLQRVSYVEYFSYVIGNVPASVPHQEGALLSSAVKHIVMPRVFFPDKEALPSDTLITEKFTQLRIINQASRHTNIPIGYIGESYIDYGVRGVVLITLCIGIFIGMIHRLLLMGGGVGILYSGVFTVAGLTFMLLETSMPKMLGGIVSSIVVNLSIVYFFKRHLTEFLFTPIQSQQGDGGD